MEHAILITGCTRGLGRALAIHFAKQGYRVYATGRTQKALASLAKPSIVPIHADINNPIDRNKIVAKIKKDNAHIFVIHNASVAQPALLQDVPPAVLEQHIHTNCLAPLLLTQALLPFIPEKGRIVNIDSGAATMALPGLLPYCITKAAMQHAITCMNAEFQGKMHCANVRPGLLDTPLIDSWLQSDSNALPQKAYYQHVKETHQLICPTLAAQFIAWVLLETTDDDFKQTAWNIYDEAHHVNWLPKIALKPQVPIVS